MTNQKTDLFRPMEYDNTYDQLIAREVYKHGRSTPSYQPGNIGRDIPIFIARNVSNQSTEAESHMNGKSLSRLEFWLGIGATIVGMFALVVGATWTISNNINEKINASRQELTGNIQSSRTEITGRIDRLEAKIDSNYKDTSSSLFKIQAILEAKSDKEK